MSYILYIYTYYIIIYTNILYIHTYVSLQSDIDADTSCSWENHPKAVERVDCEHLQPTQGILAKGA